MGVYLYPNNTETPLKDAYIWIPFPTSIVLNKSVINLTTIWDTEQLTATIEPEVSDKTITWATSDPTVATVSTTWLVTCVTPWECTITATTVNGLTASCSVDDNQWWQPWVNTIAYYPLNWDANDYSWNGYHMSAVSTVTYETLSSWIQVAKTNNSQLQVDNFPSFAQNITVLLWVQQYQNTTGYHNMWYWVRWANSQSWDSDGVSKLVHSWPSQWWGVRIFMYTNTNTIATPSFTDLTWNLRTVTYNNSTQEMSLYKNNTMVGQAQSWGTPYSSLWYFCLWVIWYWWNSKLYLSNCIVENKVRTAQEIADYYNQTKANYGL